MVLEEIRSQIADLEKQVKDAEDLINRLKAAGEDVTPLIIKLQQAKQKLERYKRAFS